MNFHATLVPIICALVFVSACAYEPIRPEGAASANPVAGGAEPKNKKVFLVNDHYCHPTKERFFVSLKNQSGEFVKYTSDLNRGNLTEVFGEYAQFPVRPDAPLKPAGNPNATALPAEGIAHAVRGTPTRAPFQFKIAFDPNGLTAASVLKDSKFVLYDLKRDERREALQKEYPFLLEVVGETSDAVFDVLGACKTRWKK